MGGHDSCILQLDLGYTLMFIFCLQYRIRGRIDTNLCTAAYLEEKISAGLTLVLSAEVSWTRFFFKHGAMWSA